MPSNENHSEHTYHLYKVRASDIHAWMDEPSDLYGPGHRWTRHNAKFIPKQFIEKYGEELARAIMIDHILLDKRSTGEQPNPQLEPYKLTSEIIIVFISFIVWILSLLTMMWRIIPSTNSILILLGWAWGSVFWFLGIKFYFARQIKRKKVEKTSEKLQQKNQAGEQIFQ